MVQVSRHPNIKLYTWSEIEELSGYVGNFKAKIRHRARFVDEAKCTGCNRCVERCPVQFKPTETTPEVHPAGIAKIDKLDLNVCEACDRAIALHRHERAPLISILQDINLDLGYLPEQALRYVSQETNSRLATVYHVATFYKAFSLEPRGEKIIKVCLGTACQVRGSQRVLNAFEDRLKIKAGQTTPDRKFTLETVNCLGACAMGPVVMVNDDYVTVEPRQVGRLLNDLNKRAVPAFSPT
jgi:NADH-quinone oxidoreductase subunit E